MSILQTNELIYKLKNVKDVYGAEGLIIKGLFGSYSRGEANENSDVDVLIEATPEFANKYGFKSIQRLNEIANELSVIFGKNVDLADSTGMGETGKKFILDRAIYV